MMLEKMERSHPVLVYVGMLLFSIIAWAVVITIAVLVYTGIGIVLSHSAADSPATVEYAMVATSDHRQVRLDTPIPHPEYLEHNYDHHPMPHPEYTRTRSSNMYSNIEEKGN